MGSVSAGAGCAVRGGGESAAVCGTVRWCRRVLGGLARRRLVLGGGEVPRPPLTRHVEVRRRQGWWYGSSDCPWWGWARGAPLAWTWWPGGYGAWYRGAGPWL